MKCQIKITLPLMMLVLVKGLCVTSSCCVGVLYWEAHLPHAIVPTKCRITVGKSRSEVKMTKAERYLMWEEFEVSFFVWMFTVGGLHCKVRACYNILVCVC